MLDTEQSQPTPALATPTLVLLPPKLVDIDLTPETAWNRYLASLDPMSRRKAIKSKRGSRVYAQHALYWPTPKTYPRYK